MKKESVYSYLVREAKAQEIIAIENIKKKRLSKVTLFLGVKRVLKNCMSEVVMISVLAFNVVSMV